MAERYEFPLSDADLYAGRVIFQVREEIPPEVTLRNRQRLNVDPNNEELSVEDLASIENAWEDVTSNTGVSGAQLSSSRVRLGNRCILYMPRAFQFLDGVVYDRVDLGRLGAAMEMGINNGGSLGNSFAMSAQQQIAHLTEFFTGTLTPDAARLAAAVTARRFTGQGDAVQSALRVSLNPNTRQLFKEVQLREFSFEFQLIPTSKEEAEAVKSIIKFFRTELYPDDSIHADLSNGQTIPIGYRFPNTFEIYFKYKGQDIAHKILPCYLANMTTNYNATGAAFYEDGNFNEVTINLNFRESRTLSKKLVQEGY